MCKTSSITKYDKGDVKLTIEESPTYFGIVFCIAIMFTATGIGLTALGVWQGIIIIFGSIPAWYFVGKDIAESHSRATVST